MPKPPVVKGMYTERLTCCAMHIVPYLATMYKCHSQICTKHDL